VAAGSFLQRQRTDGSFLIHRDVVKEVVVGVRVVFTNKGAAGLFPSQSTSNRGHHHSDGGLGSEHLEEVGVGEQ